MCAWVTHGHVRVGEPRAQNIVVCVCSLCMWLTHTHVRVGDARARILYTKMPPASARTAQNETPTSNLLMYYLNGMLYDYLYQDLCYQNMILIV